MPGNRDSQCLRPAHACARARARRARRARAEKHLHAGWFARAREVTLHLTLCFWFYSHKAFLGANIFFCRRFEWREVSISVWQYFSCCSLLPPPYLSSPPSQVFVASHQEVRQAPAAEKAVWSGNIQYFQPSSYIFPNWKWLVFPCISCLFWCLNIWSYNIMLHNVTYIYVRYLVACQEAPQAPAADKAMWSGIFTSHDSFSWCQHVMVCSEGTQICGYLSKSWEVMEVITIDKIWQDEISWNHMKSLLLTLPTLAMASISYLFDA